MKTLTAALLSATVSSLCVPALAGELIVPAGRWEMSMNSTSITGGPPVSVVTTECLGQAAFDPRDMIKHLGECELTRRTVTGNRLDYLMRCEQQRTRVEVEGSVEAGTEQGGGAMRMKMDAGGMNMEMDVDWRMKRLGDC